VINGAATRIQPYLGSSHFGLVGRHGASGYSSLRRPAPACRQHQGSDRGTGERASTDRHKDLQQFAPLDGPPKLYQTLWSATMARVPCGAAQCPPLFFAASRGAIATAKSVHEFRVDIFELVFRGGKIALGELMHNAPTDPPS
jgi:hypothetical protein